MAVIVNDNNQILIGSSPRDGGFKFPQGGMLDHEKGIDAIVREIEEELGYQISENDILTIHEEKVRYFYPTDRPSRNNHIGQEQIVFHIRYHEEMHFIPQTDEFDEMFWIHVDEIEMYDTQHRTTAYIRALELCKLL